MRTEAPVIILGGGHMGGALATCWQQAGISLVVVDHNAGRREALSSAGISCHAALEEAPQDFSAIVLAIKPQQFGALTHALQSKLQASPNALLVSIMAGVPLVSLGELSAHAARIMPNLPAVIGESMSVACAPTLDSAARSDVTRLFAAVGQIAWVEDEDALHAVTSISGSGPGYVFAFMQALEQAALAQGLAPKLARTLVQQTLRGAALLAASSPSPFATLAQQVASPGGTTQAALDQFSQKGLAPLVLAAVKAAASRSRQLSESAQP